jgi:hypothetical protein
MKSVSGGVHYAATEYYLNGSEAFYLYQQQDVENDMISCFQIIANDVATVLKDVICATYIFERRKFFLTRTKLC